MIDNDFLSASEMRFIEEHGFTTVKQLDPHVISTKGSYLTRGATAILAEHFGDNPEAQVYFSVIDYSDIKAPHGYLVEITMKREFGEKFGIKTSGNFGRSSAACTDIDVAFKEAAIRFLTAIFVTPESSMIGHRQRVLAN